MSIAIRNLCRAVTENTSYDAFRPAFNAQQWEAMEGYLQPLEVPAGHVLMEQGAQEDCSLYFVESGALSVYMVSLTGHTQLAVLNSGSVVGEGAFFSRQVRTAHVVAAGSCRLWCLSAARFAEMARNQPALALECALALGEVLAKRMASRLKSVAVT